LTFPTELSSSVFLAASHSLEAALCFAASMSGGAAWLPVVARIAMPFGQSTVVLLRRTATTPYD
jgi:hypothetical protein